MRILGLIQNTKAVLTTVKALEVSVQEKPAPEAVKLMLVAAAVVAAFEPSTALAGAAAASAPWDDAVTAIFDTLTGTLGKTIATLAVIVLGIMAMAGKLAWDTAIKVVIGIVMMFSAATIVNWIAPTMGGIAN